MSAFYAGDDNLKQNIIDQLLQNVRCSVCGAEFTPDDLTLVDKKDNVWMLTAKCQDCGSESFVMIMVPQEETKAEEQPLTEDDLADFHCWLEEFQGDFRSMFTVDFA